MHASCKTRQLRSNQIIRRKNYGRTFSNCKMPQQKLRKIGLVQPDTEWAILIAVGH
jgi:hypothetical protein